MKLPLLLTVAALAAERSPDGPGAPPRRVGLPPNVLVLVADDLGVDQVGAYRAHPTPPRTPHIDGLARDGVLFRSAWASPTCSPSRGAILTGRLPSRTGLGSVIAPDEVYELPPTEVTVARMLEGAPETWATAAIGKWHLAGPASVNALAHPNQMGFRHFAGTVANLGESVHRGAEIEQGYLHWEKIVDGEASWCERYATTETVDDALEQIRVLPEPWLVYVAFHAPHAPWHAPPQGLAHLEVGAEASDVQKYRAMVEALDAEIGRLLGAIGPALRAHTTIVFTSDNGTPNETTVPPWPSDRAKNTPFEGGIRVPLILAGPQVARPGTSSDALVHVADVFATAADVAGVELGPSARGPMAGVAIDGQSLLPLVGPAASDGRGVVFTEKFSPNGTAPHRLAWRISRNRELKLIDTDHDGPLVFDLRDGIDDGPGLRPDEVPPDLAASWDELRRAHEAHFGGERQDPREPRSHCQGTLLWAWVQVAVLLRIVRFVW